MNNKEKDKLSLNLLEILYGFCLFALGYFFGVDYLSGIVFIGITLCLITILTIKLETLIEEEK
jgi:hypothetical protein